MRILGIDPGSRVCGFGVIDIAGQNRSYVASGCIKTGGGTLPERVKILLAGIREVSETYRPDVAAVEIVFVNVNPSSTLMLGQARGAVIAALVLAELPIAEYTALQVKQAVVGNGHADKDQVSHMVQRLLRLTGKPQADAADALAVALTHAQHGTGVAGKLQQMGLNIKRGRLA
ncbi:crossover junction endodeoxyribonuclease RuvC [Andreprevotia chitinilytica]|uniref:crossover junction endodeoxyribonuclease RuvC n=1 Tax=Andreprevotia chitinilytica TaxID=396808 RepID=UPI0005565C43|nr:crossover junction endodeoxyribonuclease RuvC [Andreprevotia chitinilytica]